MARFYFDPKNDLLIINNTAYRGDEFYVEESNGNLIVNAASETVEEIFLPCFGVVSVTGEKVKPFGRLRLTDWGNGNYDVDYLLEKAVFYTPPQALAQGEYMLNGKLFSATVFKDNRTRFIIECGNRASSFDLPDLIKPEIMFQPTGLGFLTLVTSPTDNGEYLLIMLYDGDFHRLYEINAEKIKFEPRSFSVTENLHDSLGRRKITEYTFNGSQLKTKKTSFNYAEDKPYPLEITPYLLLDSIKAADYERAKEYLDDSLRDSVTQLKDFFGEYYEAVCPRHRAYNKKSDLLTVALLNRYTDSIRLPRYLKFTMNNGKITNIED